MADNYIENQYEQYLKQKAAKEAAKRAAWRKRLLAYQKSLPKNQNPNTENTLDTKTDF